MTEQLSTTALRELTVQLRSSGGQERTDAVEVAAGGCQLGWEVREGLFGEMTTR